MVAQSKSQNNQQATDGKGQSGDERQRSCDELGSTLDGGSLGDTVRKTQHMILQYYQDVQKQADTSFSTARFAARVGFADLDRYPFLCDCDGCGR
jgi:hypothetical protein